MYLIAVALMLVVSACESQQTITTTIRYDAPIACTNGFVAEVVTAENEAGSDEQIKAAQLTEMLGDWMLLHSDLVCRIGAAKDGG